MMITGACRGAGWAPVPDPRSLVPRPVGVATAAAVVLVGGRSSRMGVPKAALEWHGSTLVQRTVAMLARTLSGPIVVVRAPGQPLPAMSREVEVVDDAVGGQGPMQGIADGLGAVGARSAVAFVCSTDLPFLHPAFVRRVLAGLRPDLDVVIPVARGYSQPLAAAYRTAVLPRIRELIKADRLRPVMISDAVRALRMDDAALLQDPQLRRVDPELDSLLNVNRPEEYAAARTRSEPSVLVWWRGMAASVDAGTLGRAASNLGLRPDLPGIIGLNGVPVAGDADLPLVSGDVVVFWAD